MHERRVVSLASASVKDWKNRHGGEEIESVACHKAEVTDPYSILYVTQSRQPGEQHSACELKPPQECRQEGLRKDHEPSKRVPYIDFLQSQHLPRGCQMDEACNNTPGEIIKHSAPETRLPEVPETEVHRRISQPPANCIAGSGGLRSLCMYSEEMDGRTSLVEPPRVPQTTPTQQQTALAALTRSQNPFHKLHNCQESLLGRSHRILQDSMLHIIETRLVGSPTGGISTPPCFIHSSPERASCDLSGLQRDRMDAPFRELAAIQTTAKIAALHGIRRLTSRHRRNSPAPQTTEDAVVGALCEQILHQQCRLKVQESRMYVQERRLHQLENLIGSPHVREAWQQRQHVEGLLWEQSARHLPAEAKYISHIMLSPSVISRASSTPNYLGTQCYDHLVASQQLGNSLEGEKKDDIVGPHRAASRKKPPFCCF